MKLPEYQLLDSGAERKWERFGDFILSRPCPQAIWKPQKSIQADADFHRNLASRWTTRGSLPDRWKIEMQGVKMNVALTDFAHLGIFPEHASLWEWMRPRLDKNLTVLNLFAHSGGASLVAAQEGASVCHLDASRGMIQWARENAELNDLGKNSIRWIVDDALKFLKREVRRGSRYDGIILDPPTFGRGSKGEVFKIERDIQLLLDLCRTLLSQRPRFLIFSCHTPGFTPTVLAHLMGQIFRGAPVETSELLLQAPGLLSVPCGAFARIAYDH